MQVGIVPSDLAASLHFYRDVLGFEQITRPAFKLPGAWLRFGKSELHLIHNPHGSFRADRAIDRDDLHFALNVDDFEATISELKSKGFHEDGDAGGALRMLVDRKSLTGYPQVYLCDPDGNIIEINGAGRG